MSREKEVHEKHTVHESLFASWLNQFLNLSAGHVIVEMFVEA